jgi:CheY-like chemotaxis protein/nitrogen-specific signal transduction histidine kinase
MAAALDNMLGAFAASQAALDLQAQDLARSEAEARAADAAKTQFLGSVSHELRTPLNVILGYAQVLQRAGNLTTESARGLERITESGEHLLELIEDVLRVARMDSRALELKASATSTSEFSQALERMLTPRAVTKGLVFEVHAEASLPNYVMLDRRRLMQVLLNLTGNALKFTHQGSVEVLFTWNQGHLCATVTDTGPGISSEELTRLFQPFAQGEAGRKSGEGTGLGLHISQSLVQLMGGELRATSKLGQGCRFEFSVLAPEAEVAPSTAVSLKRTKPAALQVGRMLIVDDRATNREVLAAMLSAAGFESIEAGSGEGALQLLQRETFSLVWLDLKMPGMDGFEVLHRLRAQDVTNQRHTQVVAVTASLVDYDVAELSAIGFDALVPKPLKEQDVLDTLERQLRVKLEVENSPRSSPTANPETPPKPSNDPDVSWLTPEQCALLLKALSVGDLRTALEHAAAWGERAWPLVKAFEAFQAEPIRAKLLSMATSGTRGKYDSNGA